MKTKLAYGKQYIDLDIPDNNFLDIVKTNPVSYIDNNNETLIENALANPTVSRSLDELIKIKSAKNAVIVVNDITRPTPYQSMLPPLLRHLENGGIKSKDITLLIATGIHRPNSAEENLAIFGEEICSKYHIENHNCDDNLCSLGYLENGMELIINKTAAEADLLITTGLVALHYFAGYSGGRKSILPGIAARKLIEANHKMMSDERACLGNYENNPVSDIMIEAARKAGVDFILNVVTSSKKQIAYAAAGDLYHAWMAAVKFAEGMNVVAVKEQADIVIAGCGGYPKDINVYQAQKAIDSAALAVKKGGTIILAAECSEGLGEDTFSRWIEEADSPQDIAHRFSSHFELGGHKAYAICRTLDKANIMLLSSLDDQLTRDMFLEPVHNIAEAIEKCLNKYGQNAKVLIMPEAPKIAVKISQEE